MNFNKIPGKFFSKSSAGKVIFISLAIIFIVSLTALVILASNYDVSKDTFGRSITDTLLSIISVSVVGTLLSLLLEDYTRKQSEMEKQKEKRQLLENNRDQYRKEVLQNLNKLYANTKNARRMLRAKGFAVPYYKNEDDNKLLSLAVYDLHMDAINDSQLELESIRQEITTNKSCFSDDSLITGSLKAMDEYLGELVSEYEVNRPAFSGNPPTLRIGQLTEMKKFLSKTKKEDMEGFKKRFSENCNKVRKEIRNDINFPVPNPVTIGGAE